MVDHRRTPSQRAYQLPSWFFVVTAVLSVSAFVTVGWVFFGDRGERTSATPGVSASASPSAGAPRPSPTPAQPTASAAGDDDGARPGINVVVLNASEKPGLAASVADAAKKAGWTVGDVGNWIYPAAVNAVYYPEGRQDEAELLAQDIDIESVRPVRPGMGAEMLTVLLVYSP